MRVTMINSPAVRVRRLVAIAVLVAVAVIVAPQALAHDGSTAPAPGEASSTYVVVQGETLWSIASDITPAGGDVWDTVETIKTMNMLDSAAIGAGEKLLVPAF